VFKDLVDFSSVQTDMDNRDRQCSHTVERSQRCQRQREHTTEI